MREIRQCGNEHIWEELYMKKRESFNNKWGFILACIGSAVGAALAAFQGIDCYVPHGGFIVALATNNVALFCLDIVIGAVVAAAILIAMKPTLDKQAK